MEDHRKNDNNNKKKKNKTMHMPVQIGGMGGGGIVLLGGALVVATIVSAAAIMKFKTRRLHRRTSSSDIITADDSPKDKELMMKNDQDLAYVDSCPLNLHNPSSDWVTSNKEMETKNIQSLTMEKDPKFESNADEQVESGDSNQDFMFSVIGEDEESKPVYVESVCEIIPVDDSFEKITLGCEEQVVIAAPIELRFPSSDEDSCSEIFERNNDDEMLIFNKNHTILDEAIEIDVEAEDINGYNLEDDLPIVDDVDEASENEEKVDENPRAQFVTEEQQIPANEVGATTPNQLTNNEEQEVQERVTTEDEPVNDSSDHKYNVIKHENGIKIKPWNLKLWSWSVFVLIWCICHWYTELRYTELSLVASFFFFLILLVTYVAKYES